MTSDANTEDHNGSPDATVKLYFRNQMTSSYKTDESKLHELVRRHLKPVSDNTKVKLCIYYKTRKLPSLFVKSKSNEAGQQDPNLRHHVVYQYTCNKHGCLFLALHWVHDVFFARKISDAHADRVALTPIVRTKRHIYNYM